MRQWLLEIAPGPRWTRMSEADKTRLRARLPHGPRYPEALKGLIEALGQWCGSLHVVLAVDGPGACWATRRWVQAFEHMTRLPHHNVELEKAPLGDRVDFADIERQLRRKAELLRP